MAGESRPPGIDLEVTESVVVQDMSECILKLTALRDLGLRIIVDDFGVGYSALSYLARLPAQALKIDRSFVAGMLTEPHLFTLVCTVINMARSMRLNVIAEGVESAAQMDALRGMGCDQAQGYFIARPMPFDEVTALLRGRAYAGLDGVALRT